MSGAGERPIRVLHVEDDPAFAEVAETFLERQHPAISVEGAVDVDDALTVLASSEVDCVVSDYDLPGANGLDLLEAVRERFPDLPFILFTGKGSEEIASEAISAGVTDYLQKEVGTDQYAVLANRITNAVEKSQTEAELEFTRKRYELLGRASADAFWDLDVETGRVERSDGFARLFGYDEPAIGDSAEWWRERVHPDDVERVGDELDRVIQSGEEFYEDDYRFRNADGTYSNILSRGYVVHEDGEPERVVGSLTDVTDLKRRENELESVRARLEMVLDGTDTGVWEWDPETGNVRWDEAIGRIFGAPADSFEGTFEAFLDRVHEDDVDRVRATVEDAVARKGRYSTEFRIRRADGEVRWVQDEGLVLGEDGGSPDAMTGLVRDVTERRRREEQLKRIERRFDAVFDDPTAFMGILAPDGTLIRGNRTAQEFLGQPTEERVGTHFLETPWWKDAAPEKRAEVRRAIECAASGEVSRFRSEHQNDDGRFVVLDSLIRPVTDESGRVVSLLIEGIDVSDRVGRERMIERLHEATQSLVTAADSVEVAETVAESASEILHFSSNVVRLREGDTLPPVAVTDEAREDLGERPVYDVGEGFPSRVLESGEPLVVDNFQEVEDGIDRGPHRSALYVPLGTHGSLSIGDDEPDAFDASDVALAMTLASNAASVLDRLEGETALRRRERELTVQNERLEQFAQVISHDLRNPLNVARGRLQLLEADEEGKAVIDNALVRIERLLEEVFQLAIQGQLVGETTPVHVGSVAQAAWQTVVTNDVALEVEQVGVVDADETRLQEFFENLFRNSVEHGSAGSRAEADGTASGEEASGDGDVTTVRVGPTPTGFFVEDDGPGIPGDVREEVFESGYSTRQGGSGLGLAIVASIAHAHGWRISVDESTSGGARFEVVTDEAA